MNLISEIGYTLLKRSERVVDQTNLGANCDNWELYKVAIPNTEELVITKNLSLGYFSLSECQIYVVEIKKLNPKFKLNKGDEYGIISKRNITVIMTLSDYMVDIYDYLQDEGVLIKTDVMPWDSIYREVVKEITIDKDVLYHMHSSNIEFEVIEDMPSELTFNNDMERFKFLKLFFPHFF